MPLRYLTTSLLTFGLLGLVVATGASNSVGASAPTPVSLPAPTPGGQSTGIVVATPESIAAAKSRVGFAPKTAGWLPFAQNTAPVDALSLPTYGKQAPSQPVSYAMVTPLSKSATSFEAIYAAGPDEWVTITTLNSRVVQVSDKAALDRVALPNGREATFMDNGHAQILSWSEGEISVQVTARRPAGAYTAAELIRIAATIK